MRSGWLLAVGASLVLSGCSALDPLLHYDQPTETAVAAPVETVPAALAAPPADPNEAFCRGATKSYTEQMLVDHVTPEARARQAAQFYDQCLVH